MLHSNYSTSSNSSQDYNRLEEPFGERVRVLPIMAHPAVIKNTFYEMKPIKLGVEVRGIDLSKEVSDEAVEQMKKDVNEHRYGAVGKKFLKWGGVKLLKTKTVH